MNILFAAGGTGGHLFPAVSVAEELVKLSNDKINCYFIGTENRIESIKIPNLGYAYTSMPIKPFPGKSLKTINWIFELLESKKIAKELIKKHKIKALICTGAYLSYPPALAAKSLEIPIYVLESNVNLGKANKMISRFAKVIFTSWQKTAEYLSDSSAEIVLAGNPIRDNIYSGLDQKDAKRDLGFDPNKPLVLIIGGSLGAEAINNTIDQNLNYFEENEISLLWQSGGSFNNKEIRSKDNIKQVNFIDDMGIAYKAADIVISRSGATAIAEICNLAKPSILIPLPGAANNEQLMNGKQLMDSKAAELIQQKDIKEKLMKKVDFLINNQEHRNFLSKNIISYAKNDARETIANRIFKDHPLN